MGNIVATRSRSKLLLFAGVVAIMVALLAGCDPAKENDFVAQINQLRASQGLPTLQVDGTMLGVARSWSDTMAAQGYISHNPYLASQAPAGWTKLGENVGVGYNVASLMQAFINSPAHYANLVDPTWNYVSVGVSYSPDGRMFVTQDFMRR